MTSRLLLVTSLNLSYAGQPVTAQPLRQTRRTHDHSKTHNSVYNHTTKRQGHTMRADGSRWLVTAEHAWAVTRPTQTDGATFARKKIR